MNAKKKAKALSEEEIDEIIVAQADDDSAWTKPVRVRKVRSASIPVSYTHLTLPTTPYV